MKNKILLSGIAFTFALAMGISTAIAQQYYPLVVSTTDPTTGAQQQHTIYVPLSVANNVASGGAVYTAEPVALSSNPWADTSISSTGAQVTGTVATAASSAVAQRAATAPASGAKSDPSNPRDLPLPTWTGTNTTWNTAMGQEMIAPEINKQNMLSMSQHLRRLGYIVPDSLDTAIANAPEKTRLALVEDMSKIQNSGGRDSPMLQAIGKITKDLETNYGFSFENILDNSMRILDAR